MAQPRRRPARPCALQSGGNFLYRRWSLRTDDRRQTSIGGPGTLVFIPRNTVHSFKNVGATPACMLDWTLPGGQDRYFKKISELAAGGSFIGDKLAELNKEHNTTFVPHADR